MPPRIPTQADFAPLQSSLPHTLHFPSPPESTTAILILLHGLGDTHIPFASFARAMNLPGVLAVSVRGTTPLPAGFLSGREGWHWGDDLLVESGGQGDDLDPDPGFEGAVGRLLRELVDGVIVGKCGWERSDVLLFGFGQGGSLALGLASQIRSLPRVTEVDDANASRPDATDRFKGVVSIGGPLPASTVPTISSRAKSKTKVLLCQLGEDEVDAVKGEFEDVRVERWRRREVGMPKDREEMFPIMKFFADRLNSGW